MQPYVSTHHVGREWPNDCRQAYTTRGQSAWLKADTKLCTIGSCFAVNFSRWIGEQGQPIVSPTWGLHYNSATIRDELATSSGQSRHDIIWEVEGATGHQLFHDAKRHPVKAATREALIERMAQIADDGASAIRQADAFIVTLGLSEIWEQRTDAGWEALNRAPLFDHGVSKRGPVRNRFQSVQEIVRDLSSMVESIDRCSPIQRPLVFTVSPVPLKTTGAEYDARIANSRSKSLLIAAVHEFIDVAGHSGRNQVAYFPAFEQFQYQDPSEGIWQRDRRHVMATKVDSVCRSFCELFAVDPKAYPSLPGFQVPVV
jgi:GSCFA family